VVASATAEPADAGPTAVPRVRTFQLLLIATALVLHASAPASDLFRPDNLVAWCIVPFDAKERGPAERVAMLRRLGISQYAWDWRDQHLPDLAEEIRLARENDIRLRAIWLWVDRDQIRPGSVGQANQFILNTLASERLAVEFWVGFHENFFAELAPEERVPRAAAVIRLLREQAARSGSTVALYNHGGWFGEPENELAIIAAVGAPDVGMVFNFHHAHDLIERLPALWPRMLPHLRAVNVNGMIPGGPKILTIGEGSHERGMLRALRDAGYRGPIGILGHVDNEDVELVLQRNLDGLRAMARDL
jgi:sugar phosphate isomerase/epimerase